MLDFIDEEIKERTYGAINNVSVLANGKKSRLSTVINHSGFLIKKENKDKENELKKEKKRHRKVTIMENNNEEILSKKEKEPSKPNDSDKDSIIGESIIFSNQSGSHRPENLKESNSKLSVQKGAENTINIGNKKQTNNDSLSRNSSIGAIHQRDSSQNIKLSKSNFLHSTTVNSPYKEKTEQKSNNHVKGSNQNLSISREKTMPQPPVVLNYNKISESSSTLNRNKLPSISRETSKDKSIHSSSSLSYKQSIRSNHLI